MFQFKYLEVDDKTHPRWDNHDLIAFSITSKYLGRFYNEKQASRFNNSASSWKRIQIKKL